jgi:hypothetical protein
LADRHGLAAGHTRDVSADSVIEANPTLSGELQDDRGDQRLCDAAVAEICVSCRGHAVIDIGETGIRRPVLITLADRNRRPWNELSGYGPLNELLKLTGAGRFRPRHRCLRMSGLAEP